MESLGACQKVVDDIDARSSLLQIAQMLSSQPEFGETLDAAGAMSAALDQMDTGRVAVLREAADAAKLGEKRYEFVAADRLAMADLVASLNTDPAWRSAMSEVVMDPSALAALHGPLAEISAGSTSAVEALAQAATAFGPPMIPDYAALGLSYEPVVPLSYEPVRRACARERDWTFPDDAFVRRPDVHPTPPRRTPSRPSRATLRARERRKRACELDALGCTREEIRRELKCCIRSAYTYLKGTDDLQ